MAISLTDLNRQNTADFYVDEVDDLLDLPTNTAGASGFEPVGVGSRALCLEDTTIYILSGAGAWTAWGSQT